MKRCTPTTVGLPSGVYELQLMLYLGGVKHPALRSGLTEDLFAQLHRRAAQIASIEPNLYGCDPVLADQSALVTIYRMCHDDLDEEFFDPTGSADLKAHVRDETARSAILTVRFDHSRAARAGEFFRARKLVSAR
ncbi:MAG TPA: hypothetical protein VLE20_00545 [Blastocatellia bacterium]|nr:hypothetical protein [Blastocatellia bacterium]